MLGVRRGDGGAGSEVGVVMIYPLNSCAPPVSYHMSFIGE